MPTSDNENVGRKGRDQYRRWTSRPPANPIAAMGSRAQCAVGYLRRSTDRQEQSIPDQRRAIEAFARQRRLRILDFYLDDAISGASVAGRRAFQRMISDAQQPTCSFGFVIVYDIKRFGRVDNDEAGYYRFILREHGIDVLYASENFAGDYTDDLLRPVKQWQARQESKDLAKVTIRGLLSKQRSGAGVWMGGVPPFGYDLRYEDGHGDFLFVLRFMVDRSKEMLDATGERIRTLSRGETLSIAKCDRARLVLSEGHRVATVQRIFHFCADDGRGYSSIADWLNRRQIPTPRGRPWNKKYCGKWADSTVRAILINPLYTGDMVWNRRGDGRFYSIHEGAAVEIKSTHWCRHVSNPKRDWFIVHNAHPAIVDRRMFDLTQHAIHCRSRLGGGTAIPAPVMGG